MDIDRPEDEVCRQGQLGRSPPPLTVGLSAPPPRARLTRSALLPRPELIAIYQETHRDYFASETTPDPSADNVARLHHSPISHKHYFSDLYDPSATTSAREEALNGGGPTASVCSASVLADRLGLVCDDPDASMRPRTSQTASSSLAGNVSPVPSYTFVRELKRSVAVDDRNVSVASLFLLGCLRSDSRSSSLSSGPPSPARVRGANQDAKV